MIQKWNKFAAFSGSGWAPNFRKMRPNQGESRGRAQELSFRNHDPEEKTEVIVCANFRKDRRETPKAQPSSMSVAAEQFLPHVREKSELAWMAANLI